MAIKIINNAKEASTNHVYNDVNLLPSNIEAVKKRQLARQKAENKLTPDLVPWEIPTGILGNQCDKEVIKAALTLFLLIDAQKLSGRATFSNYVEKLARAEEILKILKE